MSAYRDSYDDGQDVYLRCDGCGVVDLDVERCIHDGCETQLHRNCAVKCESCNEVVCKDHALKLDDCEFCPICYHEALLLNQLERDEERSPV
jgi:hypothetical protein